MSIYNTRKSKKQKNGPSDAPGPASASPGRAKRGTLPKLSTLLSQLKGDSLEKKNFKVSQCRKTERGDSLGFFNIHSVAKHQKKCRGTLWGKKFPKKMSRSAAKKLEGGTLWCCPEWYVTRKNRENLFGPVR